MTGAPQETGSAEAIARAARDAGRELAGAPTERKRAALRALAADIRDHADGIVAENRADVRLGEEKGLDAPLLDRLRLDPGRLDGIARAVEEIAAQEDPVGEVADMRRVPAGIRVGSMRVPIGVILVIYESRPGVTVDAAALCLLSGNAAILRGGSEAARSNLALAGCVGRALRAAGLPPAAAQVVADPDRTLMAGLLKMDGLIDLVIPRGGKGLISAVAGATSIPTIKHLDGNCHVFVDRGADHEMALRIADNAKTQRPGVCNAMETLLVHQAEAAAFLPRVAKALVAKGVELRGCERTVGIVGGDCGRADPSDWDTEHLGLVLSVKVVDGLGDAIAHINRHGSAHTDAIVTEDEGRAWRFLREVDSSSVMANASTRFADGGVYGLGAEMGISTDRVHVRGPVGARDLTIPKHIVLGQGEVRT